MEAEIDLSTISDRFDISRDTYRIPKLYTYQNKTAKSTFILEVRDTRNKVWRDVTWSSVWSKHSYPQMIRVLNKQQQRFNYYTASRWPENREIQFGN